MKFEIGDTVKKVKNSNGVNNVPINTIGVITHVDDLWYTKHYHINYEDFPNSIGEDRWLKLVKRVSAQTLNKINIKTL